MSSSESIEELRDRMLAALSVNEEAISKALEAMKGIVKTFNELYIGIAAALGSGEMKKILRERALRDRRQQLERARKRQLLLRENTDKTNNWLRLHGLPARRRIKKRGKNK